MNYSREEKAKLLEGWRESGKSISAYVKEKGLVRWTFTKWLKAEREEKSGFVEVPAAVVKANTARCGNTHRKRGSKNTYPPYDRRHGTADDN